jgi:release factor glutamine methyltransferase
MKEDHRDPTIAEALDHATRVLSEAGVVDARRDAGTLLMDVLQRDRAYLLVHDEVMIAKNEYEQYFNAVTRRAAGEPLQYITGRQQFYGLEFEVTRDVLIPRPETELLVESAIEFLKDSPSPLVCDVGTGTGCIPISILHERSDANAVALDVSPAALKVAERNARRHGVASRMTFVNSNCFDALRAKSDSRFDLIVSNPPYVTERDFSGLQREVRLYEPGLALLGGLDGLDIVRRLLTESPEFLKPAGGLLFEIGYNQHESVRALVNSEVWTFIDIHEDLQGIPRIVALRLR